MKKITLIIRKLLHKIGCHWWKLSHQTGLYQYYECKICPKREYVNLSQGYAPLNWEWLTRGKKKNLSSKPPQL